LSRAIVASVDERVERIIAETDRYRITGYLTLPPDGYRSRLSDFLNAPDPSFLALTDVEIEPLDGRGEATHHEFLALSLSHVVLARPAENGSP
jgi:hypothetical protein